VSEKPSAGIAAKISLLTATLFVVLGGAEASVRIFDLWPGLRSAATSADAGPDAEPEARGAKRVGLLPHPYLGWQGLPNRRARYMKLARREAIFTNGEPGEWARDNSRTNRFGYASSIDDYSELSSDRYVVGILGGSVAGAFSALGGGRLIEVLSERFPELEGSIRVVNLGSPAYKQPQQVLSLSQMLVRRVPFDLIINIDGYNELVYGGLDARTGYDPFNPWSVSYLGAMQFTSGMASSEVMALVAAVQTEDVAAEHIATLFQSTFWAHSEIARAVGGLLRSRHQRRGTEIEAQLQELIRESAGERPELQQHTPCQPDQCLALITDIWETSSQLIDAMATSIGAEYIHILQPNQYVPGSKVLSQGELADAYAPDTPTADLVRSGYWSLQERGEELSKRGIHFEDLAELFVDHPETLYADPCCHFNEAGNLILARAIGGMVRGPGR